METRKKLKKYFHNFFINIRKDGFVETFKRIRIRLQNYYTNHIRNRKKRINYLSIWDWLTIRKTISTLNKKPTINVFIKADRRMLTLLSQTESSIKKQIYKNWKIILLIDNTTKLPTKKKDRRVLHVYPDENSPESDYSIFMNPGDILYRNTLVEFVLAINSNPNADIIYTDTDKINSKGQHYQPFFKPDWSPDMFLSRNYICPSTLIRSSCLDLHSRNNYSLTNGYEALLQITKETKNIIHIPKLLYSERERNDKKELWSRQLHTLQIFSKNRKGIESVSKGLQKESFRVKYKIIGNPLVSIIIPTKDKAEILSECISSIIQKTSYSNYEILVIDTGSTETRTRDYYKKIKANKKINIIQWDKEFNYSAVNNFASSFTNGKFLLFLNNDTEVISHDWIECLLEHAQRKEIGAVGARLYYTNNTIQHAGVVVGLYGPAAHIMNGETNKVLDIPYTKDIIRNWSAVTAACLMIEKAKFKKINGFDEKLKIAFNDVDLCLRLIEKGYYNLYTPYAELFHHESISIGKPNSTQRDKQLLREEALLFSKKWGKYMQEDPYFNTNYDKNSLKLTPIYPTR